MSHTATTSSKVIRSETNSRLSVFQVTDGQEKMIMTELNSSNLFINQKTIELFEKFKYCDSELRKKEAWTHPHAKYTKMRRDMNNMLDGFVQSFANLVEVCNKTNYQEKAMALPLDQIGPFVAKKLEEAKFLAKDILLRLDSKELKNNLTDLIRFVRR